jgi:hypothetical protein
MHQVSSTPALEVDGVMYAGELMLDKVRELVGM